MECERQWDLGAGPHGMQLWDLHCRWCQLLQWGHSSGDCRACQSGQAVMHAKTGMLD